MAVLEYVDRPGELRPANPVGAARQQHVAMEFLESRRGRRKHLTEVRRMLESKAAPPLDASRMNAFLKKFTHGGCGSRALPL